jgi:hypothetical protein
MLQVTDKMPYTSLLEFFAIFKGDSTAGQEDKCQIFAHFLFQSTWVRCRIEMSIKEEKDRPEKTGAIYVGQGCMSIDPKPRGIQLLRRMECFGERLVSFLESEGIGW